MRTYSTKYNVVEALYHRVKNLFDTGSNVYFSFSGGKESLVLAQCLKELIQQGKINSRQLFVVFIDEEAIFPDIERIVRSWRDTFLRIGAEFYWLCLPFFHFNCFNELINDESFILFEPGKEDVWVRNPPDFAIRSHPLFKAGDKYQDFMKRLSDGYSMVGMRADESVQRRSAIERTKLKDSLFFYPIYDWALKDVWKFLLDKNVEIPEAYLFMWKVGIPINKLRISQFFSIDTAKTLVKVIEFYPGLYEKILKREPNAYLSLYYWDSEMFRHMTSTRKKIEAENPRDYKSEVLSILKSNPGTSESKQAIMWLTRYSGKVEGLLPSNKSTIYRMLNDMLIAGDPKNRIIRALNNTLHAFLVRTVPHA